MPTDSPSSIQKPIPSSRVRRKSASSTSAPSAAGPASFARVTAGTRTAGRERGAVVAM